MDTSIFPHRHLLGIDGLKPADITMILDQAEGYVELNRQAMKKRASLSGRTIINLFLKIQPEPAPVLNWRASGLGPMSSICRSMAYR